MSDKDIVLEEIIEKFKTKIKAVHALKLDACFEIDDLENLKCGLNNQIEDLQNQMIKEASEHSVNAFLLKEQAND